MKRMSWFVKYPELLDKVKVDIKNNFPMMVVYVRQKWVYVKGNLQIYDKTKSTFIDQYTVEIQLPERYPDGIPITKEVGGRIPKIAKRHINVSTGTICPFVPDEKWKYYPDGASLSDFIKGPLTSYFMGQSYYELTGEFPSGERSHGTQGIIESYSEILETSDRTIIKSFVRFLSEPKYKGHWLCYCGSGKKLRHCHFQKVLEFRGKIRPYIAIQSLEELYLF